VLCPFLSTIFTGELCAFCHAVALSQEGQHDSHRREQPLFRLICQEVGI
jgi:hypothetical protein